jgi:polyisoprenoid-binding protein YceI
MTTYSIDNAHSEIAFTVRHMMFAKVRGQFKAWTSKLNYDAANPTHSSVEVDLDTASIHTGEDKRDAHLRSGDFFDAEKFPKMTFVSQRVESTGKDKYRLVGELTIRGHKGQVALDVEQTGSGKDPWGNERLGFSAKTSISRSEWDLKWNQALEAGGVLVSDKVDIEAEIQVVQSK